MSPEPVARPVVGFRRWIPTGSGALLSTTEALSGSDPAVLAPQARRAWASAGEGAAAQAWCTERGRAGLCDRAAACSCGLHAYAAPRHWREHGFVHGAVVAWGRIVVHQGGFRAQYARPVAFLESPADWLEPIADRYGVPVLGEAELVAYAAWHGDVLAA